MIASNLMDVYTGIFAYNQMEAMVDLLTGTGLAYIPFIGAILSTVADSYGSNTKNAVSSLEYNIIVMVLVMIFCWMPYKGINTQLGGVTYNIASTDCDPPPSSSGTGTSTGTGYDDVMADFAVGGSTAPGGSGISVSQPIAWALVEYISTSITYTATRAAGCSTNYEWLLLRMANTRISDEDLRARVEDFYTNCYKPALARFNVNPPPATSFQRDIAEPWEDIDWIGSTTLLSYGPLGRGEYYNHPDVYLTNQDKYGFVSDPSRRQSDAENAGTANPYCYEVWRGYASADGLRNLLLTNYASQQDTTGQSPYDLFIREGWKAFTTKTSLLVAQKQDLFLKIVLQAEAASLYKINDVKLTDGVSTGKSSEANSTFGWIVDTAGALFGAYGAAQDFGQGLLAKFAIKTAGPILLSMAQMVVLLAAPFLMVLSSFSFSTFFQLAIAYFSLEFINAIWAIGFMFDQRILDVLFSNSKGFDDPLSSIVVLAIGTAQIFLLPMIWLGLMAMVGGRATGGLNGAAGAGAIANMASRGASAAGGAARTATTVATAGKGGAKAAAR